MGQLQEKSDSAWVVSLTCVHLLPPFMRPPSPLLLLLSMPEWVLAEWEAAALEEVAKLRCCKREHE
jgi:hypothetical protein